MLRRIKSSLNAKTFIIIATLLILSGVLIYTLVFIYMPKTYRIELNKRFNANFRTLIETLNEDNGQNTERYLQNFCISNNTSVYVTDKNLNIIYSIQAEGMDANTIPEMTDDNVTFLSGVYKCNGEDYIVLAYAKMDQIDQVSDTLMSLLPFVFIFILGISLLGSLISSRALTKPIIEISKISKKLSELNLTWFCDVKRTDEIGSLAGNLNEMAKKLDKALSDLKSANENLQKEIKRRDDLFMAISHELKTPVTVMRCDLEGMLHNIGRYKDREKYLEHALQVTESMESLIQEILQVGQIGSDTDMLEKTPTDLNALVYECCNMYQELALKKKIDILCKCDKNVISDVDPSHMLKAVSNIIGNAVYHSPERQTVIVSLKKANETATLTVENTGVHIASDEFDHIFEPFCRVDKSRNRHTGGSGLGLYIVKVILEAHQLHYTFKNTEQGVRFEIIFPLSYN